MSAIEGEAGIIFSGHCRMEGARAQHDQPPLEAVCRHERPAGKDENSPAGLTLQGTHFCRCRAEAILRD